jgi:hypothetical protein
VGYFAHDNQLQDSNSQTQYNIANNPVFFAEKMIDVWSNYKKYEVGSKRQSHFVKSTFSFEKMVEKVSEYYNKYVKETPKLILPTLPKLTKIN